MKVKDLEKGQTILVLRYSLNYRKDIIEQHEMMLKKKGYVWYGKLGNVTSPKIVAEIMEEKNSALLLYTKGKAYLCALEKVSRNKPQGGYPNYYDEEYICPGCYYKLLSIDEVECNILNDLIVRSSQRVLSDTLSKQCTSSCFFVSYKELLPLKAIMTKKTDQSKKLSEDDCIYKKEKMCKNTSCINFGYKCNKPSVCTKQKR